MTKQRILELIPLMPDDAPFLKRVAPKPTLQMEPGRLAFLEKYSRCITDPAFGWHFIEAFLSSGRRLPAAAFDTSLLRAYHWLRRELPCDRPVLEALTLGLTRNPYTRDVLDALLLIPGLNPGEICRLLTISRQAVRMYSDLFFNVIDRRDEPDFIRQQVYPNTRRVLLKPDYLERESTRFLLRRAAYDHGLEALKHLAGFRTKYGKSMSAAESARKLECQILNAANFVLALGGVNSNAPILKHARHLVMAAKHRGREERPPSEPSSAAMGLDSAVAEHLQRAVAPDPLRLVQKELDREAVASTT